jgi:hypothetical protein
MNSATIATIFAAAGLLRAAAPPSPPTPTGPSTPIQGPAWVAMANRPKFPPFQTEASFCATNVGSAPVTVYMVAYNTANDPAVHGVAFGILGQSTQTLQPLQTTCATLPLDPPMVPNMWLFGATIAGQNNPATVLAELQSLVVSVQFVPLYAPFVEGTFVTPLLLGSVQLPGNTMR